jgi:putative ABC transport system permease protein
MRPPRLPQRLLERLLDARLADAVLGDLAEIFRFEARHAPAHAYANYWRRAAGVLWHLRRPRQARRVSTPTGDGFMAQALRDFTRGFRLFAAQPAFAWAAVVTLALAIGANTLIFTIANVLVVKPLPIQGADRLGWILVSMPGTSVQRAGVSLPEYAEFRDRVPAFGTTLAAWRRQAVTMRVGNQSDRVLAQMVIGDVQGLWGLHTVRGRALTRADELPGAPKVVVVAHQAWQTRFGGAEDIVGRMLVVDGVPHSVVGVLSPEIELGNLAELDLWLPFTGNPALQPRATRNWRPVGRLQDGVPLADAASQVAAVAQEMARDHPEINRDWLVQVGTTRRAMTGANAWLVLSLLAVVVGLLLLLACANVMNLLIARLIGRRQELAVRTALGATRGQVVRQIVSESMLLGLAGGLLGLSFAAAGLRGIHAFATEPLFRQLTFDVRVLLFAIGLSFVAPLVFSIVPTLRVLRDDVRASLAEGGTRTIGGRRAARSRSGLVVLQLSLAVTLLIVSALVVQSMQAVVRANPGFDPSRLLSAQIDVAAWKEPDDLAALQLRHRILEHVAALPGVTSVALATELPALQFARQVPFDIDGRATDERDRPRAGLTVVSRTYFDVVGVPIEAGRGFAAADAASARAVAVVSAETARRFWRDAAAAPGSSIRIADTGGRPLEATVIGVSRNVANPDLDMGPGPMVFVLDEHLPSRTTNVLVRADAPAALAGELRAAIAAVDPDLPAFQLRTVSAAFADENSSNLLLSGMFAAFAAIAILLAMAGLYGVMSYAVSQRSPELAVRLALGAPARAIAGQVVGQSLRLTVIGTLIGTACAYALARSIASLLYGVTAADLATYAGAALLTLVASMVATWLPMRRAATIDPLDSLRRT